MTWLTAAFVILMFGHWLADFVCQTDYMALNKSRCNKALTWHVFIYSLVTTVFYGIVTLNVAQTAFAFAILFGTHWVTDYVTSRASATLWKENKRKWFFTMIGFDQFLHLMIIWSLYKEMVLNEHIVLR